MNMEKVKAYNNTQNAFSDCLTECDNFTDLDWCREFGCELLQFCEDVKEEIGLMRL